jgi:hypothetical protein
MKKQIRRVSPHQNGKVFGVLMAVSSLIFLLPMFVFMFASMPEVSKIHVLNYASYIFNIWVYIRSYQ